MSRAEKEQQKNRKKSKTKTQPKARTIKFHEYKVRTRTKLLNNEKLNLAELKVSSKDVLQVIDLKLAPKNGLFLFFTSYYVVAYYTCNFKIYKWWD